MVKFTLFKIKAAHQRPKTAGIRVQRHKSRRNFGQLADLPTALGVLHNTNDGTGFKFDFTLCGKRAGGKAQTLALNFNFLPHQFGAHFFRRGSQHYRHLQTRVVRASGQGSLALIQIIHKPFRATVAMP